MSYFNTSHRQFLFHIAIVAILVAGSLLWDHVNQPRFAHEEVQKPFFDQSYLKAQIFEDPEETISTDEDLID